MFFLMLTPLLQRLHTFGPLVLLTVFALNSKVIKVSSNIKNAEIRYFCIFDKCSLAPPRDLGSKKYTEIRILKGRKPEKSTKNAEIRYFCILDKCSLAPQRDLGSKKYVDIRILTGRKHTGLH